jgi:uncharacterized RDD family membrane protein YckC
MPTADSAALPAPFFQRLLSLLLDLVIMAPLFFGNIVNSLYFKSLIGSWLIFGIFVFLKIGLEHLTGQSPGKWALNLKLVNADDFKKISLKQSFKRNIVSFIYFIALMVQGLSLHNEMKTIEVFNQLRGLDGLNFNTIITSIIFAATFFYIINLLCSLISANKRTLLEMYSNTRCLKK